MNYNTFYTLNEENFLQSGDTLENYKHTWITYKFIVNQVEYSVLFFYDSSGKTCVGFKQAENVNFDNVNNENINAHEVFSKVMLAVEHYKNLTGVTEYKYQTNNQQKHNIYQMMATRLQVNAINTEEITE
jgi:hypothetical protein